jgi:hypothetical protein
MASHTTAATSLEAILNSLDLNDYLPACHRAGFHDWDTLASITEHDFDTLDMRLGDRRKLQREIASRLQWPADKRLPTVQELLDLKIYREGGGQGGFGGFESEADATDSDGATNEQYSWPGGLVPSIESDGDHKLAQSRNSSSSSSYSSSSSSYSSSSSSSLGEQASDNITSKQKYNANTQNSHSRTENSVYPSQVSVDGQRKGRRMQKNSF